MGSGYTYNAIDTLIDWGVVEKSQENAKEGSKS
jgi:hypothetical protein